MKNRFKILLCVLLSLCFVFGAAPLSVSAEEPKAVLNNIYGDGMLFQQKEEVVLKGTASSGAEIHCELKDSKRGIVTKAKTMANKKGGFTVSFTAPKGGYENYTITLYENGVEFRTLKDIVFGELWLASGQSNMQYSFSMSETYAQNSERSEWLRFLYVDVFATYNGAQNEFPDEPQQDFENGCCYWLKGTDNIDAISAVSFFFAQELQKKLDMPVGVLMPNLGGSLLVSWLSRQAVESDSAYADYVKKQGLYLSCDEWDSGKVDWFSTMTANYNKKVAPLQSFNIAGMIWYQGESEVMMNWERGYYKKGLELLQSSYGELFGFKGKMPFIATQVAPFAYGDCKLSLHNNEFIEFAQGDPSSRAITTIYDIDLGFTEDMGGIHPWAKQPVGERMAASAEGLVYGRNDCFTAATVESTEISGSDFYVTLKNVGDGLVADGKTARGFSLADENGIFVQADAEIVGKNKIRIYSDEVKSPVSAAYAFAQNNTDANVYSTLNGEKFMPIAPFATNTDDGVLYWEEPSWADCDTNFAWFLAEGSDADFNNIWNSAYCGMLINENNPFKGSGCFDVFAGKGKFSIFPAFTYLDGRKDRYFDRMVRDWSKYSSLSVMVRNNGSGDIILDKLKIRTSAVTWFAPEVNACGEEKTIIPADGQWHKLTFDLNKLYLHGNECGAIYSRRKLSEIDGFELCFKNRSGDDANISVDDFRFTGDASEGARGKFEPCINQADNPWEFFCSIFSTIFSFIAKIFTK